MKRQLSFLLLAVLLLSLCGCGGIKKELRGTWTGSYECEASYYKDESLEKLLDISLLKPLKVKTTYVFTKDSVSIKDEILNKKEYKESVLEALKAKNAELFEKANDKQRKELEKIAKTFANEVTEAVETDEKLSFDVDKKAKKLLYNDGKSAFYQLYELKDGKLRLLPSGSDSDDPWLPIELTKSTEK